MDSEVAQRLVDLNRLFYQTFAGAFEATRRRLQPGVRRLLGEFPTQGRILDLGCGNGELWRELGRRGWRGTYIGLDFSPGLLQAAGGAPAAPGEVRLPGPEARFIPFDLSADDWQPVQDLAPYDLAVAFAVLHHLPGKELRRCVLQQVRSCLPTGARFFHSEWQFLNSERQRARIQPWEKAGLSEEQVDPGDYLLDWRSQGYGLRYVHHFTWAELACLAQEAGFAILVTLQSDGQEGNLSIYQVWSAQ